ncbi:MAG: hypothetical protein K2N56_11485 [Oscillospiraceae bacterium]|nr:hypothetical protein [Oscillospiraceae bacterium]
MGASIDREREFAVSQKSEAFCVDVRDDCFLINGQRLEVPSVISEFETVLGKARGVKFEMSSRDLELMKFLMNEDGSGRTNYAWDELGMMGYTNNGTTVKTFGVVFKKPRVITDATPDFLFGGKFTVNGADWYDFISGGVDRGTSRHARVGKLALCAAYLDCDRDNELECPKDNFSGIEISL